MSARHRYNGAPLTPQDVNAQEAMLLLTGIGALVAVNTLLALKGRTVVCKLVRRTFRLNHEDPAMRRRGWLALDTTLLVATAAFRWHLAHPWERSRR